MKEFIKAKEITEKISESKLNKFADILNAKLSKGDFSANTGLDHIPLLNDAELKEAKKQALKDGYILTELDDNYGTTSYRLNPLYK